MVLQGIDVNIFLLVFLGFGVGVMSGFTGVGGGFFLTPALIVLGFPANFAVGTSLAWIVGNSIVGVFRHRRLGNVDMKLGLVMIVAAMGGTEIGVRIINWAKDLGLVNEVVLSVSICLLFTVGTYTLSESIKTKRQLDGFRAGRKNTALHKTKGISQKLQGINLPPMLHFSTARITISLWFILFIGFFVGMLAGLIGVGGGFIMVPSLIYLVGLASFTAVGTDLFQIIFSASYGTIRHTISGNVIIFAAFIMLLSSSIGVQLGALVTQYVRGVSVRFILGISILLAALGTTLKLSSLLIEAAAYPLSVGSIAVTFSGIGLACIIIITLLVMAIRYQHGQRTPAWIESLLCEDE